MKYTFRRVVATATALGLLISPLAVQQSGVSRAAAKAKVSSVKITNVKNKKLSLVEGKTLTLKTKVKVKPNKAKYKKVTYKSSAKKIVSVSKKGKLRALKQGKAKITVTSKTNKKKKIVIAVTVRPLDRPQTPTPTSKLSCINYPTQPPKQATATPVLTDTPVPTATPTPSPSPTPTAPPDGTSTLMRRPFAEQAYVGTALSDVPVKEGFIADSNGNPIKGSYVWEETDITLSESGKTRHMVKFVPDDSKFATVENISIPVITIKNQIIVTTLPTARSIATGNYLKASTFSGGSVKDSNGNTVAGEFGWADGELFVREPGTITYAAVFTPEDTTKYRTQLVNIKVKVTGDAIEESNDTKSLDLTGGTWKNEDAYTGMWGGSFYNLTPYIAGIDMSKYTKLTVEANVYDANNRRLTDASQGYIGFKLANREGDWAGFSDAYVNSRATLSLGGYNGGDLYLVAQNMQASVAYIEITSITLEQGSITNVNDGSSLKLAFGDIFGKVGNAVSANQANNGDTMRFLTSQYNSMTMGNETKPDNLLGSWNQTLLDSNPQGYVDTSTFTYPYKDSKYPQINLSAIDSYMETAYKNGIKMRFHVFVWHEQTPQWFFKKDFDSRGDWVTPEVMNGRLEYYIRNVMTHVYSYQNADGVYIGREVFDKWDMANEYTHNSNGDYKSYWDEVYYPDYEFKKDKHSGILDPVYIKQAFAIGHSILKDFGLEDQVSLVYNDFNTYFEADKIVKMINYVNTRDEINPDAEIICDGVGMQMHLDIGLPTVEAIGTNAIDKFKEAGFEIQMTEMDATDYSKVDETQARQIKYWYNLMLLLMVQKDSGAKITGIVWWGLADNSSWRRDGVPLLFSSNWQAKQHYFNVIDAASWYTRGDTDPQYY